jgi:hypothetical protein
VFDWDLQLLRFTNWVGAYLALLDERYLSADEQQSVRLDLRSAESLLCMGSLAFELHEAHRRREPLADERGQLMDDGVGMLELGAGEERRVARDVGQQQVAPSGSLTL